MEQGDHPSGGTPSIWSFGHGRPPSWWILPLDLLLPDPFGVGGRWDLLHDEFFLWPFSYLVRLGWGELSWVPMDLSLAGGAGGRAGWGGSQTWPWLGAEGRAGWGGSHSWPWSWCMVLPPLYKRTDTIENISSLVLLRNNQYLPNRMHPK